MPLQIRVVPCPLLANFACEFQHETPNPKPYSFVADISSKFVQNIFNLALTERIQHVKHHCQADNFGEVLKYLNRFCWPYPKLWGLVRSVKFLWQHLAGDRPVFKGWIRAHWCKHKCSTLNAKVKDLNISKRCRRAIINVFFKGVSGAPEMRFNACPKRHLVSVSSYFNRLAKRQCRSTVKTLPASLPAPLSAGKNNRGPWAAAQYAAPRLHQIWPKIAGGHHRPRAFGWVLVLS